MTALDDDHLLAFLKEILSIDSTSGREERVVHRIVEEMAKLGYQRKGQVITGDRHYRVVSRRDLRAVGT